MQLGYNIDSSHLYILSVLGLEYIVGFFVCNLGKVGIKIHIFGGMFIQFLFCTIAQTMDQDKGGKELIENMSRNK